MAGGSDTDRVWELMDRISTCMLTTHDGDHIRSRPMRAFVRRDEDAVYFLGDAHQHVDRRRNRVSSRASHCRGDPRAQGGNLRVHGEPKCGGTCFRLGGTGVSCPIGLTASS